MNPTRRRKTKMKNKYTDYRINVSYDEHDISFEDVVSIPEPNSKKILHGSIKYFNENYSGKKMDGEKYSHPTLSVVGN